MGSELAIDQPRLIKTDISILLKDNARPHISKRTLHRLQDLNLGVLCHSPYSSCFSGIRLRFARKQLQKQPIMLSLVLPLHKDLLVA